MIRISNLLKLIRIELETKGRLILIVVAAAFLILCYAYFDPALNGFGMNPMNSTSMGYAFEMIHFFLFPRFLLGLGLAITSLSWYEYRRGQSRNFHLTIPTSLLEKWMAKIITYSVLLTIFLIFSYQLYGAIINRLALNKNIIITPLTIMNPYLWKLVLYYMILQPIVLLASSFSQRFTLFKALAIGALIIFLFNKITVLSLGQIIKTAADGSRFFGTNNSTKTGVLQNKGWALPDTESIMNIPTGGLSFYFAVLVIVLLVCYSLSYLRFREMES